MTILAPGVYTSVTAAAPSSNGNAPTGTWFVTGQCAAGPVGVAIPVTSMNDFTNYCGGRTSYGYLYDAMTEFFHDGGISAYVSRVVGASAGAATINIGDKAVSPQTTLSVTAVGVGTAGNYATTGKKGLSVVVATGTVSNSYTLTVKSSGSVVAFSTNLFSPNDAVVWANSLKSYVVQVHVVNAGSTHTSPTNNPANGTYTLSGGTTTVTVTNESLWTNALLAFTANLGPGQVSAPGHSTSVGFQKLLQHAAANNRVAVLDVTFTHQVTATMVQALQGIQSAATVTATYGSFFAPWVVIPGISSANPSTSASIPTRTIPPSALAAAQMAKNDAVATKTCNTPAAGNTGQSTYAIGVSVTFSQANLATLNAAGVNIVRIPPGTGAVTVYGYQSTSLNPNWSQLNNVRFRMQMIYDFDNIGETFVFKQVTGRGQLISVYNGALAGKCQNYWVLGALFGTQPGTAFSVNTGPQVNTKTSIQNGFLKAIVNCVMSPFADVVQIQVVKYLLSTGIPSND